MNLYIGQLRGEMLWLKMIICIAFLAHTICIMCDLVDVYGDAMTSWILVNTGFGDGLLPGGTNIESLSTEPSITVFDYIWPNMTIFIQAYIYIYISTHPRAAYMRQQIGSALVQIMACRLFGAKPLSEPVPSYC